MFGGKKDKVSIKDKTKKKKCTNQIVHQFEKLLCLFSDIKQFWPLKKQFKRGTSHVAKIRLGYLGTL